MTFREWVARLFNRLMKSWSWILLIVLSILIKWASWYPGWVENNYSQGVYPFISKVQRFIFGWIPVSVGDLFYAFLLAVLLYKMFRFIKTLIQRKMKRAHFIGALQQGIFMFLFIYVFFNLLWGLNYNRKGIAYQLGLEMKQYSLADLDTLTSVLHKRVNEFSVYVTEEQRDSFNKKNRLFSTAADAYNHAAAEYPFLAYKPKSLKPSMYSYLGNYLGFQGYYNPFVGEGQVNTTIPRFLEPYVTAHEIAHQLGYAKESEANFVGYLACRRFSSMAFRYSTYFDLYNYALFEIKGRDMARARFYQSTLNDQVLNDQEELRAFQKKYNNPIEPIIMWGYSQFLKANNQPAGKRSYNEVVTWLIAYYKKFGAEAL